MWSNRTGLFPQTEKGRLVRIARFLLAAVLVVSAFAADIAGKWKATGEGPDGAFDVEFNFKTNGDKLTGTATGPMGEVPITDIKVEGDKISFNVDAGDFMIVHKGAVSGNEMKLKVEMGDQTMDMTAKRAGS